MAGRSYSKLLLIVQLVLSISRQQVAGQGCNFYQELVFGEEYYISNPEYPANYSSHTNCYWDLRTAARTKIYFSCSVFNIPASRSCNADRLAISPSGKRNFEDSTNYCGQGSFSLISQGTKMLIGLHSTSDSHGGYFICTTTAINDPYSTSALQSNDALNCDCGWKQLTRIVRGEDAKNHEFPFMAALIYKGSFWCGTNIISDRFVLTVGHCVLRHDPADHHILVGDSNLNSGNESEFSALYKISAYELHPRYEEATQRNDIALLQTATKIIFSPRVGPICLPFRFTNQDFAGHAAVILGWGQIEFTGPLADVLQKATVNIVSNQQCSSMQSELITNGEICTHSSEQKDSCQSDSGGPVAWIDTSTNRYQLLGLISRGVGCGSVLPAINTRVTEYLQWIVERTSVGYCIK